MSSIHVSSRRLSRLSLEDENVRHATLLFCAEGVGPRKGKARGKRGPSMKKGTEKSVKEKWGFLRETKEAVQKARDGGTTVVGDFNELKDKLRIEKQDLRGALYSLFHHTSIDSFAKIVTGGNVRWCIAEQF